MSVTGIACHPATRPTPPYPRARAGSCGVAPLGVCSPGEGREPRAHGDSATARVRSPRLSLAHRAYLYHFR